MNNKIIELTIEIIYGQEKFSITKEEKNINFEEDLIRLAADKFKIDKKLENNIVFYYKDEYGDINKIKKIEDIYKAAKQLTNSENYISTIYLEISENEVNNSNNKENTYISSKKKNNTDEIFQKIIEKNEKMPKNNNSTNNNNDKGNSNSNEFNENTEKKYINIDIYKIENCIKKYICEGKR